jgi:hypothetical protein
MYYSQRALAVSALGGPEFTTRFLGVEREVWDQGAQFIVFTLPVDRERVNGLRRFLAERGQACSTELVAGQFLVCHGFSQPVFPGQYLPATDRALFERHTPVHPAKIARDRANVLW